MAKLELGINAFNLSMLQHSFPGQVCLIVCLIRKLRTCSNSTVHPLEVTFRAEFKASTYDGSCEASQSFVAQAQGRPPWL